MNENKDKLILKDVCKTRVRFSEVDSMKVVWHGNYPKYLEDGRESFGIKYGLGYQDVYAQKVMTPVVKLDMDYKNYLPYGEEVRIETEYQETLAAKIIFKYKIFKESDNQLIMEAKSIQVFVDMDGELMLTCPEFYEEWKLKWGLTK